MSIWVKDSQSGKIIIDQNQYQLHRPGCEIKIADVELPAETIRLDIMFDTSILGTIITRKTSGVWRYYTFTVDATDNYPIE